LFADIYEIGHEMDNLYGRLLLSGNEVSSIDTFDTGKAFSRFVLGLLEDYIADVSEYLVFFLSFEVPKYSYERIEIYWAGVGLADAYIRYKT
jgi:hypothetical protein